MKTLIITDMHSEDPLSFIKKMQKEEGIEKLVCLGDCDDPSIAKRILALDIEKRFIISNHDYYHSLGVFISSEDLEENPLAYKGIWERYPDIRKMVLDDGVKTHARNIGSRVIERIHGKKVVYTHGSTRSDEPHIIMNDRLITGDKQEDELCRIGTFQVMINRDYWINFRGHDHISHILSIPKKGPIEIASQSKSNTTLSYARRYIVTVGSFKINLNSPTKEYAIFDEATRKLEFRTA